MRIEEPNILWSVKRSFLLNIAFKKISTRNLLWRKLKETWPWLAMTHTAKLQIVAYSSCKKILFLPYLQKSIWKPWCCCTTRKFTITLPNDLANCNVSLRLRWYCLPFRTGGEGTSLLSWIGNCLNKQPQRKKVCRWQNMMHTEHLYKFFFAT